jgi:competence ComEA-like helix-hairpin-helix protein
VSDKEPKGAVPLFWTPGQLRGLLVLLTLLAVTLAIRLARNHTYIDDPEPDVPARATDLADRMDPNTATWEDFAAIPGLGEKKAQAIVAYRDQWTQRHPDKLAFAKPEDLHAVKGIGPATISNMSQYLIFPTTAPQSK